jgi:hypothetical protein
MDRDLVATEAEGLHLPPEPLDSPTRIDDAVDYLLTQLTRIADVSTPRRKVSQGRGESWWTGEVHEALHQHVPRAGVTLLHRQNPTGAPSRTPAQTNSVLSRMPRQGAGVTPFMKRPTTLDSSGVSNGGHGCVATNPLSPSPSPRCDRTATMRR